MRLALFEAMALHDTGERLVRRPPLQHVGAKAEWEVNHSVGRRYMLDARFRASVVLDDMPNHRSIESDAVRTAQRRIAREVFGPLADMADSVRYHIHNGDEAAAHDTLGKMITLMNGGEVTLP